MILHPIFLLFVGFLAKAPAATEVADPVCEACRQNSIQHEASANELLFFNSVLNRKNPQPPKPASESPTELATETNRACPGDRLLKMTNKKDQELGFNLEVHGSAGERGKKGTCEVAFKSGCGNKDVSAIEKLDWMKTNLRKIGAPVCEGAVNEFAEKCGPWAGLSPAQRKAEALRLAAEAVKGYTPDKTAAKIHGNIELKKSPYLTAHLVQCLMHRENSGFEPNKLNYTECKSAISSANGLFQLLESTVKDLTKRGVLGNYCWQFGAYWKKILREKPNPQLINGALYPRPKTCGGMMGQDLVQKMSGHPEFQASTGVATLNYFLEMAALDPKFPKPSSSLTAAAQKAFDRENTERLALDNLWFTTGNPEDSANVMKCERCLDAGQDRCL